MAVKKEFFIERQGQKFVLYAGLLDEAHEQGLKSITTTLLQIPTPENQNVAICQAVVEMGDGRIFTGIGDAAPNNVSRPMVNAIIRFSETRSKARALRDAINYGGAALEELGDDNDTAPIRSSSNAPLQQRNANTYRQQQPPTPITNTRPALAAAPAPAPKPIADNKPDDSATITPKGVIYLTDIIKSGNIKPERVDKLVMLTAGHSQLDKLTNGQAKIVAASLRGEVAKNADNMAAAQAQASTGAK